jgi:hypothetical protein
MPKDEGDSSFLGPSYDYWKNIKQPRQMGMSPGFSLGTLSNNVSGLLSYVEVLVSGSGEASKTGEPLGNKFFLRTNGKCREVSIEKWKTRQEEDKKWQEEYDNIDSKLKNKELSEGRATKLKNALNEEKKRRDETREKESKKIIDRWIYINNIPDGTIPFIANGADGRAFDDLRGLIPGAMGNLAALNPAPLFKAFVTGTTPDCAQISLETVDETNTKRIEKRHLALMDVKDMNPCIFGSGTNPVSGNTCQKFTTIKESNAASNTASNTASTTHNTAMLVAENGESVGIYETGSLAGSTGLAYQTTHRSPLSYNIANNKATSMSGLEYSKFEIPISGQSNNSENKKPQQLSSKNVVDNHNIASSSFYNTEIHDEGSEVKVNEGKSIDDDDESHSIYDTLMAKLSNLLTTSDIGDSSSSQNDGSKIEGGVLVEIYYASIAFIMLYFIYKLNYTTKKR